MDKFYLKEFQFFDGENTVIPCSSTTLQATGLPSKKKRLNRSRSKNTGGCSNTTFPLLSRTRRSPR